MDLIKLMIFCALTAFLPQPAFAAMSAPAEIHIEQAVVTLPEISVYLRADAERDPAQARAFLGVEPLTVENARRFDPSEGIFYIFLVDVSGSILERQTQAIKEALKNFAGAKGEHDRIALIAFGDKTDILLDGKETDAGVVRAGIDLLRRDAPLTYFYEAINHAMEFSAARGADYPDRRVAVVISDGGDDTTGGRMTREEVAARLTEGNLPFYGFALQRRDARNQLLNKTDLDSFGELVRLSQGKGSGAVFDNDVESGNIDEKLRKFRDYVEDFSVMSLKSGSNIASGRTEVLSIQLGEGEPIEISVRPDQAKAIKDTDAPGILKIEQLSTPKNTLRVRFSEHLRGAGDGDLAAAVKDYVIVTDKTGDVIPLPAVVYGAGAEGEAPYCDLTFDANMYSDTYNVSFRGLTDQSFEKNPLTETAQMFTYMGRPAFLRPFDQFGKFWWLILILAIFAAIGIVYLILRNRKGLVMVEGQVSFGDRVEVRHHFEAPPIKSVALIITDAWGNAKKVNIEINQSFFVGRDESNNMRFDDERMSRQHFSIEAEGEDFFLTDLESTNGTFLNGVQIKGRRQLRANDTIQAGQEKFVFLGGR
jgi:hypothetical protein